MDLTTDAAFVDAVAAESGLLVEQVPLGENAVLRFLKLYYGLGGDLVRIPTEKDETFRLEDGDSTYLVKLSSPEEDPMIVNLQTACMEHLERVAPELPVQRIVKSVGGASEVLIPAPGRKYDRVLRVMRFMPGLLLANHTPSAGQMQQCGSSLAKLSMALQDFDHPRADRMLLWDLKHFHRMRPLLEYVKDREKVALAEDIFDRFDALVVPIQGSLTAQVIHGDFSPFNVLVDPNTPEYVTGIIDFGDAVRSPVIFDVSVAMANHLGAAADAPWRRALQIVDGYRTVRHLPVQELEALAATAPARLLLRALITQWRAIQRPETRDYLISHSKPDWDRLAATAAASAPKLHLTI